MLTRKPEVGDVIVWTNQYGERFVWKIMRLGEDGMYGERISPQDSSRYGILLNPWDYPQWSQDFGEWVKTTRRHSSEPESV